VCFSDASPETAILPGDAPEKTVRCEFFKLHLALAVQRLVAACAGEGGREGERERGRERERERERER
jgi:hypothetical protein